MQVVSLFRYPVKSLPGHAVETLPLDAFGPRGDRRWMLVDADGQFISQRKWPQLSQLQVQTDADRPEVVIQLPGGETGRVAPGETKAPVKIWRDQVEATVGEGDAAEKLSRWLGKPVELVYMGDDDNREVDPSRVERATRVGFADGFPFLVVNQASLEQLESWVGRALDIRRFRPNIVVKADEPFEEDHWQNLKVGGSITLQCVKPCSRCVMTTVDPITGQVDPGQEPLRTLGRFRRTAEGVIFGQNAVHLGTGSIRVGDVVSLHTQSE